MKDQIENIEQVLDLFPLSDERINKLYDLTKDVNYKALMLNKLIESLNHIATQENALALYSTSQAYARMLSIKFRTIEPKKTEQQVKQIKK